LAAYRVQRSFAALPGLKLPNGGPHGLSGQGCPAFAQFRPGALPPGVHLRADDFGFVVRQDPGQRYDVHGAQNGDIVLADTSVTQVGSQSQFAEVGLAHGAALRGANPGSSGSITNAGTRIMVYSPF